ncbi:MAG: triose-phosphate isomerase [Patescibacteria group bacterium]|nr:triose-phosphate isomerase [Patescibacteria group bacterium]
MKNIYVIANWKMQLNLKESVDLFNNVKQKFSYSEDMETVICPSYTSLPDINRCKGESKIRLGAQDVFWEDVGAYTGEISCEMLKEVGCNYSIIGHSDRRKYFKESDEIVHYKLKTVLKNLLVPIVCVGETFQERQEGKKEYAVINQITKAMSGIDLLGAEEIIVAYEPIWVIGSGRAINAEEAEYMHQVIKQSLIDIFSVDIVEKCFRIIYGGSINQTNIKTFLVQPNIKGVLVGGASLNPDEFLGIISEVQGAKCY